MNNSQRVAMRVMEANRVTFLLGPAGTGKTLSALRYAHRRMTDKSIERVYVVRRILEACDDNLGFIPGDVKDKVDPYCSHIKLLIAEHKLNVRFEFVPIAYLRGRTLSNAVCILDEAQNCTVSQFRLFFSRLGRDSYAVVTGDSDQSDIGHRCCVDTVASKLSKLEGIGLHEFTLADNCRLKLNAEILRELNGM